MTKRADAICEDEKENVATGEITLYISGFTRRCEDEKMKEKNTLYNHKNKLSKMLYAIQMPMMIIWVGELLNSDSNKMVYLVLFAIACVCFYINVIEQPKLKKKKTCLIIFFSICFSIMVLLSNYRVWAYPRTYDGYGIRTKQLYALCMFIVFLIGGFCSFWNIFYVIFKKYFLLLWKTQANKVNVFLYFAQSVIIISVPKLLVLYLCRYPGRLTSDSLNQITEGLTGRLSNWHPIFHTLLIKLFVDLGTKIFGDLNASIALYSSFQIILTSMAFSFALVLMLELKTPSWIRLLSILFFTLTPYHILYAFTMWKDVLWSCFVLCYIIYIFRIHCKIGSDILNFILFIFSGIGVCLMRSNGLFVFGILIFSFIILLKKEYRMIIVMCLVFSLCFFVKHPLFAKLGISNADPIESLSIPLQQVSRVVFEKDDLSDSDKELINIIIDYDGISDIYISGLSDPIKDSIRKKGNEDYFISHKKDYLKLYLKLGLRHPFIYIKAWADQTRGYWNSGYEYDFYGAKYDIYENNLGIKNTTSSVWLDKRFSEFVWSFTHINALSLLCATGLFVWLNVILLFIALIRNDRIGIFVCLPVIAVVISLIVATPVYAEFRYIFSAFCTLPIVYTIVCRPSLLMEENK